MLDRLLLMGCAVLLAGVFVENTCDSLLDLTTLTPSRESPPREREPPCEVN
jgi:hypothetical protein